MTKIDSTKTPAEEYNIANIDTSNQGTYAGATENTISGTPTDTITDTSNLYNIGREGLQQKISETGKTLTKGIQNFNEGSIVDKMRLKTGGVADIDSAIENLKIDLNTSRPTLMERYADVIDPRRREALISAEESGISKQISELSAIRKQRLGTIQDMTNAEITIQENRLKGLEAQLNLYQNVLGDLDKADKTKNDMEKTALDIQKKQIELKGLEDKYGLEFMEGKTTVGTGTTENRPDRNNNPGNVKLVPGQDPTSIPGAVGQDDEGHIMFDNPQSGYDWMVRDLNSKLTGQTRTGLTPQSTLADLGKVYAEDPNWINNVVSISGIPKNTLLKDIDVNQLAPAVARAEGFTGIDQVKTGYVKTGKTAEEKKEASKKAKLEQYNISNAKDFNALQKTTSSNIVTKMSPEFVDKTLEDDIGKWELSSTDVDKLLAKSSDEVYNKYVEEELVDNLTKETDVDVIVDTVKDALATYSEDEMIAILKRTGVFDKEGLQKGFIDDAGYDRLQELLPSL